MKDKNYFPREFYWIQGCMHNGSMMIFSVSASVDTSKTLLLYFFDEMDENVQICYI